MELIFDDSASFECHKNRHYDFSVRSKYAMDYGDRMARLVQRVTKGQKVNTAYVYSIYFKK